MNVKIELLADSIFGSGASVPGGEDLSVLCDEYGFPYLRGTSLKGLIRREMENYLVWTNGGDEKDLNDILGKIGLQQTEGNERNLFVSDFILPVQVRQQVLKDLEGRAMKQTILNVFSSLRTFTALENGVAEDHSLRTCRCITKGLMFFGTIECNKEDEVLIKNVLSCLKWIGSMKTRGFGRVKVSVIGE